MADRTIRLSLRLIRQRYGPDAVDVAGDDLIDAVNATLGVSTARQYVFSLDTTNPNPWFHVLLLAIPNISDADYLRISALPAVARLLETSTG